MEARNGCFFGCSCSCNSRVWGQLFHASVVAWSSDYIAVKTRRNVKQIHLSVSRPQTLAPSL